MTKLLHFLSLFIIATIPVPFAAVQPWVWSIYSLLMIIVFVLGLWTLRRPHPINSPFQTIALGVFFIWSLILVVPFPPGLLPILSPMRAEALANAWKLTGDVPIWQSISYAPTDATAWWIFLLSLTLFFVVVRHLCEDRKLLKRIITVMIMIGLAESIYGLVQALVPSMGVLWVDYIQTYLGSARGTFINRNNFAGFVEMIWPLALGLTLSMTGRVHSLKMILHSDKLNRQALMAMCIIVFLLTLILTRSRGGIISGMAGVLIFFILARQGMQNRSTQIKILLSGIVGLLIVYTLIIGIGPVIDRFFTLASDGSSRINIWRDSLQIIRDHPLGIGLHNYADVIEIYNQRGTHEKTIGYAHNDYLQLLIETGWVGFVSLIGAMVAFLIRCTQRIGRLNFRKDPLRFYVAVGAFSGITSIAVHSLFDFNLQIPANCVYFVVLMAILSACTQQEP